MNFPSPMTPGSTPLYDRDYRDFSSATPSPRRDWTFDTPTTPIRPATRATHGRAQSYSQRSPFPHPQGLGQGRPQPPLYSPHPWDSPLSAARVDVDVSPKHFSSSSRRNSASFHPPPPRGDRRHSYSHVRASTPYGESDEDEVIETLAGTYILPAQSRCRPDHHGQHPADEFYGTYPHQPQQPQHDGGRYTNVRGYQQTQTPPYYYPNGYDYPAYGPPPPAGPGPERGPPRESPQAQRFQTRPPTSFGHSRHSSMATPKRPSTARPQSSHKSKPKADEPPAAPRKATEADAKLHRIPAGYALKNWDPEERPILLLGSVFDFNSLGKWIFDWTVYREGRLAPITDIAGELWLLLIQLNSKIKVSENVIGRIRNSEDREMLEDFLESGERLMDKLRSLLKACEAPMLNAAKKRQSGLGKSSGVEFVHTLFGPDRQGEKTDRFMQSIRLFCLRFDANCDDLVRNPTR